MIVHPVRAVYTIVSDNASAKRFLFSCFGGVSEVCLAVVIGRRLAPRSGAPKENTFQPQAISGIAVIYHSSFFTHCSSVYFSRPSV
jgi:hypothetical protein